MPSFRSGFLRLLTTEGAEDFAEAAERNLPWRSSARLDPIALSGASLLTSIPNPEALARMTSPAVLEIQIATEGPLAVVTSRAGVVAVGKMFERARRADLSLLRQSPCVVMTIRAADALARAVLCVTEAEAERTRVS